MDEQLLAEFHYVAPDDWSGPRHAAVVEGHAAAVLRIQHAAQLGRIARSVENTEACKAFARTILDVCSAGRQRSLALERVELARMWANYWANVPPHTPNGTPSAYAEAWLTCLLEARMWASAGIAAEQRRRNSEVTDG